MAFSDVYRVGAHAVITNHTGQVLLLKATYGDLAWGLPGGGIDPDETILEGLKRECREELGVEIEVEALTGVYLHAEINAHVSIFRCHIDAAADIILSHEHSDFAYHDLEQLSAVQRQRVEDCIYFNGEVIFRKF
ncbi:NUDIX hydrolase [Acinetobacter soli]|uniref:NUDIX hydrolase n=1 Tax=Acinetobacter soli TaxID=487316 RepID=UPI001F2BB04D|nr:NUDIX domain-containing protein [Acinetobacter soli]MCE6008031.1 NUDIX domain-containing protein [Acinetobacter soli]